MCGKVVEAISRAVDDCIGKKWRGPGKEGAFVGEWAGGGAIKCGGFY
jgi:hypothetical protein